MDHVFIFEQEEDQASDIIKIGLENELKTSIPVSHTLDKRPETNYFIL
jgi:hypothetical protein